jgi:NTP pyrophosphatase (non-canonical NTP hydrolase)
MLKLNDFAKYVMMINLAHGFDGVPSEIDTTEKCKAMIYALALVITEISEAIEGVRKQDYLNLQEELADAIIRILHICAVMDIDIEKAIREKMIINESREYLHGKVC